MITMCDVLQLDALPIVLQETIVGMVSELGIVHTCSLRSCSRQWRSLCSSSVMLATVPADKLADQIPSLNGLPNLQLIIVRGKDLPTISIGGDVLSHLHAGLKALSVTSEHCKPEKEWGARMDVSLVSSCCEKAYRIEATSDGEEEHERQHPRKQQTSAIVIENLELFLQPWIKTLQHLHLDHCTIAGCYNDSGYPCLFGRLSRLRTLHLVSLNITPPAGLKLAILYLTGCTALQHFDCRGSSIGTLCLSGCTALESLYCQRNSLLLLFLTGCSNLEFVDCKHNQLATLSLSQSPRLKVLDCSHNKLTHLALDPSASLQALRCVGVGNSPMILGDAYISHLACTAESLKWITGLRRQKLVKLSLRHSLVGTKLSGFKDLRYLRCRFGRTGYDCLDLTNCNSVELNMHCEEYLPAIIAQKSVCKLTLKHLGSIQPDLCGFVKLQELHLTLHGQNSLNLWGCRALKIVMLAVTSGEACPLADINLAHCVWLEQLHMDGFRDLTSLDLAACGQLKALTCRGSSIQRINVSMCPLLTTLDISNSLRLRSVWTSSCDPVLYINSECCGKLERDKVPQGGSQVGHTWNVTALDTHAMVPAMSGTIALPIASSEHCSQLHNVGVKMRKWTSRLFK